MGQALEVIAGRELRYHAAEFPVQVDLRVDDVGEDAAAVLHDGDGRFVAAGFDAQGQCHVCSFSTPTPTPPRSPRGGGLPPPGDPVSPDASYAPLSRFHSCFAGAA